ncbi:hypothetical protein [Pseudomonas sp. NBRC 111144]|uniref:hypothetical protein n=1 Tax=Pseudomonas sp. NBRC 111144 TaxID=1661059 RepID=UPI0006D49282|nr:hypothetical protein [Pseudomonas sp. NBRC 111144]
MYSIQFVVSSTLVDAVLHDYDLHEMPTEVLDRFAAHAVILAEAANVVRQRRADGLPMDFDGKDAQACCRGFA